MFSRDFARSLCIQVHPTVDLALDFHKFFLCLCFSLEMVNYDLGQKIGQKLHETP